MGTQEGEGAEPGVPVPAETRGVKADPAVQLPGLVSRLREWVKNEQGGEGAHDAPLATPALPTQTPGKGAGVPRPSHPEHPPPAPRRPGRRGVQRRGRVGGEVSPAQGRRSRPQREGALTLPHPHPRPAPPRPARSEYDEDGGDDETAVSDFIFNLLQELHPGIRISSGSIDVLRGLLDTLTEKVVLEAVGGGPAAGEGAGRGGAGGGGEGTGPSGSGSGGGAGDAPAAPPPRSPAKRRRGAELTAREVQEALRRVLPGSGEPGRDLRPYLPSAAKQARHLDREERARRARKARRGPGRPRGGPAPPSPAGPGS